MTSKGNNGLSYIKLREIKSFDTSGQTYASLVKSINMSSNPNFSRQLFFSFILILAPFGENLVIGVDFFYIFLLSYILPSN